MRSQPRLEDKELNLAKAEDEDEVEDELKLAKAEPKYTIMKPKDTSEFPL